MRRGAGGLAVAWASGQMGTGGRPWAAPGEVGAPEPSDPCDFPTADPILGPLHAVALSLFKHR